MSTDIRAALERLLQLREADAWALLGSEWNDAFAAARAALATKPVREGLPAITTSALLHPAYEPGDGSADGAQLVGLEWWHPVMGCDSLQMVADNACAILRSRWAHPATPPGLPPNYIDPEHTDQDQKLLEVFYEACQSEGGTTDEINLRGICAVLAARSVSPSAPEAGIDPNLQDTITWLLEEAESAVADDCPVAAGRLTRAATLLQQQAARIAELEAAAAPPVPELGEVEELVAMLLLDAKCLTAEQPDLIQATNQRLTRAATLLQQQAARIAELEGRP